MAAKKGSLKKASSKAKKAQGSARQTNGATRKVGYLYIIMENYAYPSFPMAERKQVEAKAAAIVEVMERHNRLIDVKDEDKASEVEKRVDAMLKEFNVWLDKTQDRLELEESQERSAKASEKSKKTLSKINPKEEKADKPAPKKASSKAKKASKKDKKKTVRKAA